jgi:hypothetical protein
MKSHTRPRIKRSPIIQLLLLNELSVFAVKPARRLRREAVVQAAVDQAAAVRAVVVDKAVAAGFNEAAEVEAPHARAIPATSSAIPSDAKL